MSEDVFHYSGAPLMTGAVGASKSGISISDYCIISRTLPTVSSSLWQCMRTAMVFLLGQLLTFVAYGM